MLLRSGRCVSALMGKPSSSIAQSMSDTLPIGFLHDIVAFPPTGRSCPAHTRAATRTEAPGPRRDARRAIYQGLKMMLPGKNKLVLNEESMRRMLEDAINAATLDGEDYIYVRAVEYSWTGKAFEIELTTDREKASASDQ